MYKRLFKFQVYLDAVNPQPAWLTDTRFPFTGSKIGLKNSLIIHEENTKKNHKRVVSLYVDKDFPSFT